MTTNIFKPPLFTSCGFLGLWPGDNSPFINQFHQGGEYCVYVLLDSWYEYDTTLCGWSFPWMLKYIGMGPYPQGYRKTGKRPLNHRDDLFSDHLKLDPDRYILTFPSTCLDKQSAFDLESILIDAALEASYTLSPRGLRNVRTPDFQLINKIRGYKINGSYLRQVA